RVTHTFENPGQYVVELQVTDSNNAESIATKNLSVDADNGAQEIADTIRTFLVLFGDMEHLSAQQIVVGFSKSSQCSGRQKEIDVIERDQPQIRSEGVSHISVVVDDVKERTGTATATAEFFGVLNDGTSYD